MGHVNISLLGEEKMKNKLLDPICIVILKRGLGGDSLDFGGSMFLIWVVTPTHLPRGNNERKFRNELASASCVI